MKEHLHSKQFRMLAMYSFCHQEIIVEEIKQKVIQTTVPFAF